ncbi:Oleoyl-(acyl-carrier-protein) hydrolase [Catenulispora acidiphila DSM 44928]|uniref:Oleoyl-(Acyl-carrier-protein) hydrolase n=1 Tax=Catenulispora acidiphila (strain DSM 44928 / JCM 14897 / NBRC 102108 / NRRL B-24433 / ID139908) TaxID=479433 RepID=C7Q5S6_CATAD|nr:alpha/beta fold hydrolase [Catenulispora acidiphila]ACU70023.1 Oleoyl-(acyl-carrier-protein) hydrolase [Catenulispora acidiphila DSM 44928]
MTMTATGTTTGLTSAVGTPAKSANTTANTAAAPTPSAPSAPSDTTADQARWLRHLNRRTGGIRLFCLPDVGAGATTFRGWPELLGPGVEVTAVQLPGREDRIRDRAHESLDELLDELVPVLADAVDGPYALFGHSMGALIAFEAARRLVAQGAPAPLHLFASAHGAPHAPYRARYVSNLPEPEFRHAVVSLNGFREGAPKESAFLSLLLPTLRADFRLCETYEFVPGAPLPCRLTVLTGADEDVSPLDLALWRELHTGRFRIRVIDGDRDFVVKHRRQVAEVVRAGLAGEY